MIDRRTLLSSTATGIFGLSVGAVVLNQATEPAEASVSMGSLDMEGASTSTKNGYIEDIEATVSGSWSYEIPGGEPDISIVQLRVSDGNSWATVAESSETREYKMYEGDYTVSGSILDTELFDVEFFGAPSPGKQITVDLPFKIIFQVQDSNQTPLANASIEDTATVSVGQNEINASMYGEVNGEGTIEITK